MDYKAALAEISHVAYIHFLKTALHSIFSFGCIIRNSAMSSSFSSYKGPVNEM